MARESPRQHFDLVTAHYVHPEGSRQQLLHRLAAAVALGGTLFLVEHDHSDEHAHARSSTDRLAASLDPESWEIEAADTRERRDTDPPRQRTHLPRRRPAGPQASMTFGWTLLAS